MYNWFSTVEPALSGKAKGDRYSFEQPAGERRGDFAVHFRRRTEGAPYLMVIRLPAIVAEAPGACQKQLGDAHRSDEESGCSHQ